MEIVGIGTLCAVLFTFSRISVGVSNESILGRMVHDFGLGFIAVWEWLIKPALTWLF